MSYLLWELLLSLSSILLHFMPLDISASRITDEEANLFRNLRLPVREGVEVGYEREIDLLVGRKSKIKTLSLRPLVFEVPDFLTPEECDYLIFYAQRVGLYKSPTHPDGGVFPTKSSETLFRQWDTNNSGYLEPLEFTYIDGKGDLFLTAKDISEMFAALSMDKNADGVISVDEFVSFPLSRMQKYFDKLRQERPRLLSRQSNQTWLWHYGGYDELLENFHERLSRLTLMPKRVIERSEPMQIVSYNGKGHYQCHHDSDELDLSIPCCTYENQQAERCRLCRYITVMYYLNDVELGGQTAFPVADNSTFDMESWIFEAPTKCNLVQHCDASNVLISPRKGTAILWYNHETEEHSGWMGELDRMTYHGGCEVLKGEKWIANNWINIIGKPYSLDFFYGWTGRKLDDLHDEF